MRTRQPSPFRIQQTIDPPFGGERSRIELHRQHHGLIWRIGILRKPASDEFLNRLDALLILPYIHLETLVRFICFSIRIHFRSSFIYELIGRESFRLLLNEKNCICAFDKNLFLLPFLFILHF